MNVTLLQKGVKNQKYIKYLFVVRFPGSINILGRKNI